MNVSYTTPKHLYSEQIQYTKFSRARVTCPSQMSCLSRSMHMYRSRKYFKKYNINAGILCAHICNKYNTYFQDQSNRINSDYVYSVVTMIFWKQNEIYNTCTSTSISEVKKCLYSNWGDCTKPTSKSNSSIDTWRKVYKMKKCI